MKSSLVVSSVVLAVISIDVVFSVPGLRPPIEEMGNPTEKPVPVPVEASPEEIANIGKGGIPGLTGGLLSGNSSGSIDAGALLNALPLGLETTTKSSFATWIILPIVSVFLRFL
ncbi:unnamed protein product [Caenorhabditis auriculariae]|uniref:Uncharacterized protein n=1 Tax=Caenorhabditis auriculariae TaxID=2777116 RepID=A0A8S1GTC0_9PELO|nr:unnamed protein product [Caenorhabditis auriculariae]